jgi:hypothetical protein
MKTTLMKIKDFAVFILTHGRPNRVFTLGALRRYGYTGPVFFIVDNEDKTIESYYENFGMENVFVFDKKSYADRVDEGNNFDERRTITHARNACFDIAKKLGITYFMQLDDDYTAFQYTTGKDGRYITSNVAIRQLDRVFLSFLNFFKASGAKSVALSQGGDFIGGDNSGIWKEQCKRKAMNSFICSTERPFQFIGAMNEDVNTYTTTGSRGSLFFTSALARLKQKETQSQAGGITDMYLKYGTYCKAFTTVMMMPSSVRVAMMGAISPRLHHRIKWNNTVPKILRDDLKK